MKAIIEAAGVSYSYPGTSGSALDQLTLRIPHGKKTAICGHNGSGKSTLFLHMIGLCRPQTGELSWKDSPYSYRSKDLTTLRQRVGLVFQDPEQQLILSTPYEDVTFGLRNAGFTEKALSQRSSDMLAAMGLAELAHTPIHHLSLGQKKRVALAGVLALEPELLLLDEPTAYLDRASEKQLVAELDRIHGEGVSIVMATHDMNLAYAWAEWVIVMHRGACVTEGPPSDVFARSELLLSLGLEPPLLRELWEALPAALRAQASPPRTVEAFKTFIRQLA